MEEQYPGLTAEYDSDTPGGRGVDDTDDDDNAVDPEPRVRLRNADVRPTLFAYQRELVEGVERVCTASGGRNVALLALPTGAGKTRTAAVALLRLMTYGVASVVLWLAPTRELLQQAAATWRSVWLADRGAADLDIVRADLLGGFPDNTERGVLLATPQMVAAQLRRGVLPDADVIVFDEAHHVEAPVFRRAVQRVRQQRRAAVLGLSATPGRTVEEETERLVDFFDGRLLRSKQLGRHPITALQRRGVLARVVFKQVPTVGARRAAPGGRSGADGSLDIGRFRAVVNLAQKLALKARVLVFAASVDHARLLAAALRCAGTRAAAVSSRDTPEARHGRLHAFERGELSVLVNKRLLATGYDCPAIRHVILATRVSSPILFEQIVGRASRGPRVGGHARSTVWQFDDHLAAHGLPQSYYRYSDYDWEFAGT